MIRRLNEILLNGFSSCGKNDDEHFTCISNSQHYEGPLLPGINSAQFQSANLNQWEPNTVEPRNCVLMKNNEILLIENFIQTHSDILAVGHSLKKKFAISLIIPVHLETLAHLKFTVSIRTS